MKKRGRYWLLAVGLWFVVCAFFLTFASAYVGLTPAGYSVNFQPNLRQVFNFNFYSDDPNVQFDITATGDLAEYVEVNRDELSGSGAVNVLLKLPREIEKPGVHRIYVEAAQRRKDTSSTLAIVANVRGIIDVRVPYPGKYAEMEFSAEDAKAGEPVNFKLVIHSRGEESITTSSLIEIIDSRGKTIDIISLGTNEINSKESVEINKLGDTNDFAPGKYTARAIVRYNDKEISAEYPFRLGELYIEIINWTKEFEAGKINKINVDVESFWNDPIQGVYAEIYILGYESMIPPILTPSISLNGFDKKTLEGFFDTTPIQENKFKAKAVLHYGDKTTEKIIDLRFRKEVNYTMIGIIAGAIILIAAIIALALWVRRLSRSVGRANGKTKK